MLKKIIIVIALLLLNSNAYAGTTLNLQEALGIALEQNHMLKAAEYGLDAKQKDINIARSYYMPSLSIEERYMRTDNPTYAFSSKLGQERFTSADFDLAALNNPEPIVDYQTTLSLQQLLYSRKASLGLTMAKINTKAEGLDLTRKRDSVAFEVTRTYFGVLIARQFRDVTANGVQDAMEHSRISKIRHKNGLGLYSDTLRAEVAIKEAQTNLIEADNEYSITKQMLGLLLGLDEEVDAVDTEIPVYEKALTVAPEVRADLQAMKLRVQNAGNAAKMGSSAYFPTLAMNASYILNDHETAFGNEGDSYMVGVQLSWNFYDGGRGWHENQKARLMQSEASQMLEGMQRQASLSVHVASLKVDASKK
ncbi:TolC family protein, partial [bacterium]|nr:TolC family protein [bacterium]